MKRRCYVIHISCGLVPNSICVFCDPTADLNKLKDLIEHGKGCSLMRIEEAANQLFHDEWEWMKSQSIHCHYSD